MKHAAYVLAVVLFAAMSVYAQTPRGRVEGRISDKSGLPLPGVTVTLARATGTPLVVHTDDAGHYVFDVAHGHYTLTTELSGFADATRPDVVVGPGALVIDIVMDLGGFKEETQVIADAPRVFTASEPTAPATVDHEIIKMAPVQGTRYDSALPLLPGAVRGPDGLISLAGARSWQGTVLVDRMRENDPVTGEPLLSLPVFAIDNVQVHSPLPPAEAGPSTGGVTNVITRAAIDAFMFDMMGLFPRPRFSGGGTSGIEAWQPTFGFSGPLSRGRVWLAQSVEYRYERFLSTTVAGAQDSSLHGYSLFTRLDIKPEGPHVYTLRVIFTPTWNRHYGLSAFVPAASVPDLHTSGVSVALVDRTVLGRNSTLESHVHVKQASVDLTPASAEPFVIGHEGVSGGFYRTIDRDAYRLEAGTVWSQPVGNRYGEHLLKAGLSIGRMAVSGVELNRPVIYLRSDGTLTRSYTFAGSGALDASLTDGGLFLQDTWTARPGLKVDVGARLDSRTGTFGALFLPRAMATYDIRPNSTKISGGLGGFTDKSSLAPDVFAGRQARQETLYDATGQTVLSARWYANRVAAALVNARSLAWNLQLDQTLGGGWTIRAAYHERIGRREYTVQPVVDTSSTGTLGLSGDAGSQSWNVDTTAGYRSKGGSHQFYISYVRAWTEGNLNDLNTVTGMLAQAQVLPDQRAALPVDVPHRVVAWGMFSLPWRVTISPFMEVRSGFPFTRIDEDWNVVGIRNDSRFPMFLSVDLAVEKALRLPGGFPARLGVKIFNITGRNNGREIQRDVSRADFGQLLDPIRRQLRGTLEISWNR